MVRSGCRKMLQIQMPQNAADPDATKCCRSGCRNMLQIRMPQNAADPDAAKCYRSRCPKMLQIRMPQNDADPDAAKRCRTGCRKMIRMPQEAAPYLHWPAMRRQILRQSSASSKASCSSRQGRPTSSSMDDSRCDITSGYRYLSHQNHYLNKGNVKDSLETSLACPCLSVFLHTTPRT